MIKLYEKDSTEFTEISEEELDLGFENGTITTEIIEKGKSAETIFNELKEQGIEVTVHNGIYCKVVYNTFEAINPIPPTVRYVKA